MSSSSSRLIGIDLAYVIATIGSIAVSFLFVIGRKTSLLDHVHYFPLLDIFPAWFFFLNGLTTTLMMRDGHISSRKLQTFMGKKGSMMFLIGLIFCPLWPLNMFIVSGLFYILAPFVLHLNSILLRVITVSTALITIALISFTGIKTHIVYTSLKLQGSGLGDLVSFIFFNGYYSILPWIFFFMLGMIHGRGQVRVRGILQPSNILAVVWMVLAIGAQSFSIGKYQDTDMELGTMFPLNDKIYLPSFILLAMGTNTLFTNGCIYLMKDWPRDRLRKMTQDLASVKYSLYFFHLVLGAMTYGMFQLATFGGRWGILIYILLAEAIVIWFSLYWKHRINDLGPVEWMIKRISGSAKK